MAVACMPPQLILAAVDSEAHRPRWGEVQDVEPPRVALHAGEEAPSWLAKLKHGVMDRGLVRDLIQLSDVDYVAAQTGYKVHLKQHNMLTIAALEHNCPLTLDVYCRSVAELDRPAHSGVQFGEDVPPAGHVVAGAGVQVPRHVAAFTFYCRARLGVLLVQKHVLSSAAGGHHDLAHARKEEC